MTDLLADQVLGLSHIYGETTDLPAARAFWQAQGLRADLETNWAVPEEKRSQILVNQLAQNVSLVYFSFPQDQPSPGIEFLSHGPSGADLKTSSEPSISLYLRGATTAAFSDGDKNRVVFEKALSYSPTLLVDCADLQKASELLRRLGGQPDVITQMEKQIPGWENQNLAAFRFHRPLFSRLSARIVLREKFSDEPCVDSRGWHGLSFLVKDFASVEKQIALIAHQKAVGQDGVERELGFYREAGLLIEFLQLKRNA